MAHQNRKPIHKIDVEGYGSVEFYAIPVTNERDFSCTPANLFSLEQAKQVALDIGSGRVIGEVGEYNWTR